MRPKFQGSLETYNDLAKDRKRRAESKSEADSGLAPEAIDADVRDIDAAIAWHVKHNAGSRAQKPDVQREIFSIQERKAAIMEKLQRDIMALDEPPKSLSTQEIRERAKELGPDTRFVKCKGGRYVVNKNELSLGDILTDGEWGLTYDLDPASVPRRIRKRYLVEAAKRELRKLLDEQIILDELESEQTDAGKKYAYGAFREMKGKEDEVGGWIAERLVKTFLTKLAIDHDLDFEIINTDVYEDVRNKIDFVVRRKQYVKGVKVASSDDPKRLGIQFTMNTSEDARQRKLHQLNKVQHRIDRGGLNVEKVVLVTLPLDRVRQLYKKWNEKRSSGGPEELWSTEEREQVFRNLLKDVVPPAEIEAQWRAISSNAVSAGAAGGRGWKEAA